MYVILPQYRKIPNKLSQIDEVEFDTNFLLEYLGRRQFLDHKLYRRSLIQFSK